LGMAIALFNIHGLFVMVIFGFKLFAKIHFYFWQEHLYLDKISHMRKTIILIASIVCATSTFGQKTMSREQYILAYQSIARAQMEKYGVPASIILAQGMLESGNGNSTLAVQGNNHFGIKCHNSWSGQKIYHDDDAKGECFRKYKTVEHSYRDHSEFLRGGRRYASLFDLAPTDFRAWAKGLKDAGYATDPQYADRLIKIIEENKLYIIDRGVDIKIESPTKGTGSLVDPENFTIDIFKQREVYTRNRIKYIKVKEGDTYEKLTREMELMPWQLAKYNDMERGGKLTVGQDLYFQPKRSKAEPNHPIHTVEEGETMYAISQLYGIKLKSLYKRNRMSLGTNPEVGEKIYLRGHRPKDK